MRVVFIGAKYYNNDPQLGLSYEYSQIGATLEDLGLKLVYVDSLEPNIEQRINQACVGSDLIFFTPIEFEFDYHIFDRISLPKVFLFPDDEWRRPFSLQVAPLATYVMSTARDASSAFGDKYIPFQWGARIGVYKPVEPTIPISFFGQKYGYREELIKFIERLGLPVKAYGAGWTEGISDTGIVEIICKSKISLTTSMASRINIPQIKARNFEITAGGALLMAEYAPGLEDYFTPDKEAAFWREPAELADKLYFYLTNESARRKVAMAGRTRTVKEHDFRKRMIPLLERLGILVRN